MNHLSLLTAAATVPPVVTDWPCEERWRCSGCGEDRDPSEGHFVDCGIGAYDFWGQRGMDVQYHWVSTCCDAPIKDDRGRVVGFPPCYEED